MASPPSSLLVGLPFQENGNKSLLGVSHVATPTIRSEVCKELNTGILLRRQLNTFRTVAWCMLATFKVNFVVLAYLANNLKKKKEKR